MKEKIYTVLGALFFAFITGVLGPTLDAHAAQTSPKFMASGDTIIFQDDRGQKFMVGESWESAQTVAEAKQGQDTVWLLMGETGARQCEQKWVVLRTGPKHPQGTKWEIGECYIDDYSNAEIKIYPKSAIIYLGDRSIVVK